MNRLLQIVSVSISNTAPLPLLSTCAACCKVGGHRQGWLGDNLSTRDEHRKKPNHVAESSSDKIGFELADGTIDRVISLTVLLNGTDGM